MQYHVCVQVEPKCDVTQLRDKVLYADMRLHCRRCQVRMLAVLASSFYH